MEVARFYQQGLREHLSGHTTDQLIPQLESEICPQREVVLR
jgi:hypothetical protein